MPAFSELNLQYDPCTMRFVSQSPKIVICVTFFASLEFVLKTNNEVTEMKLLQRFPTDKTGLLSDLAVETASLFDDVNQQQEHGNRDNDK
jgi:hypothetical protein